MDICCYASKFQRTYTFYLIPFYVVKRAAKVIFFFILQTIQTFFLERLKEQSLKNGSAKIQTFYSCKCFIKKTFQHLKTHTLLNRNSTF